MKERGGPAPSGMTSVFLSAPSRDVTDAPQPFAPGLLRPLRNSCGIPSTWQRRPRSGPGGSPRTTSPAERASSAPGPSGGSALCEVDGMPHPARTYSRPISARPAIPGDLPRGERLFCTVLLYSSGSTRSISISTPT